MTTRHCARHRQQSPRIGADWGRTTARLGRELGCGAALAARRADSIARRIVAIVRGEVRIIDGVLVVSTRGLWVVWCAAMLGVQMMPRDIVSHGLTGEGVAGLVALTWGATTIMLVTRFWRWRQQKRWRETAGRMAAAPATAPADEVPADPGVEALRIATANTKRLDALTTALATAFDAADHEVPDELTPDMPTGPMLRLVVPLADSEAG